MLNFKLILMIRIITILKFRYFLQQEFPNNLSLDTRRLY